MNLYLMRHAIAADPAGDMDDSQRPLTGQGRKKLRKIAKNLGKIDVRFDLILTAPTFAPGKLPTRWPMCWTSNR